MFYYRQQTQFEQELFEVAKSGIKTVIKVSISAIVPEKWRKPVDIACDFLDGAETVICPHKTDIGKVACVGFGALSVVRHFI